jgi:hypothetical protein
MKSLSSLAILITVFALIPTFTQAQSYVISNYLYSSGGHNLTFQVGPSDLNIPGLTTKNIVVGVVP